MHTSDFLEDLKKLKQLRIINSDAEIVESTGVDKGALSKYINGKKTPSRPFLDKFYKQYGKHLNTTNVVQEGDVQYLPAAEYYKKLYELELETNKILRENIELLKELLNRYRAGE